MDANEQFAFPSPQPNDTAEVRSAIEQAGILWSEDPRESLKWLRKAAEFASDAGDDLRSVQLARVSADLRNLANIAPSLPPTTLPPPSALLQAMNQGAQVPAVALEPNVESEGTSPEASEVANTETEQTSVDAFTDSIESSASEVTPSVPLVTAQAVASGFAGQSFSADMGTETRADQGPARVDDGATPALTPEQVAAFMPNMAFGKDPAQTVPATPAATAAAAALANGPSNYQPFAGFQTTGYAASAAARPAPLGSSAPLASPGTAPRWAEQANPSPADNGKLAMNTPAATPASKRPATLGNAPSAWTGGPRPEQPTLVGSPLNGFRAEDNFRADAGATDPSLASRFVQHRAIAVAVSMSPNSSGHFDLHPLAEGEQVEPGFRMALLVGLSSDDRLFPGRG